MYYSLPNNRKCKCINNDHSNNPNVCFLILAPENYCFVMGSLEMHTICIFFTCNNELYKEDTSFQFWQIKRMGTCTLQVTISKISVLGKKSVMAYGARNTYTILSKLLRSMYLHKQEIEWHPSLSP